MKNHPVFLRSSDQLRGVLQFRPRHSTICRPGQGGCVKHLIAFDAAPGHVTAALATPARRVADENTAGAEPVPARAVFRRQRHVLVVGVDDKFSDCGHGAYRRRWRRGGT